MRDENSRVCHAVLKGKSRVQRRKQADTLCVIYTDNDVKSIIHPPCLRSCSRVHCYNVKS